MTSYFKTFENNDVLAKRMSCMASRSNFSKSAMVSVGMCVGSAMHTDTFCWSCMDSHYYCWVLLKTDLLPDISL